MATEKQIVDLFDKVGGHVCSFEVGNRTDPIFFSFCGRLRSVRHEYDDDTLQIIFEQSDGVLGQMFICPKECKVKGQTIYVKASLGVSDLSPSQEYTPINITQISNSSKTIWRNELEAKKTKDLECPYCNRMCSSTSGLTLHKKGCKERPKDE